jgi:hypothetical protein
MPQKPQDRAKDKRRLTKRLAKWRAKQEPPAAAASTPKEAAKTKAPAAKAPAAKAPAKPKT